MNNRYIIIAVAVIIIVAAGIFFITQRQQRTHDSTEREQLQQQIYTFLDTDKGFGMEATSYTNVTGNELTSVGREHAAVTRLLNKMEQHNCTHLPEDFCSAYTAHMQKWKVYVAFLDQQLATRGELPDTLLTDSEYIRLESDIEHSYDDVIAAAQRYGVTFQE